MREGSLSRGGQPYPSWRSFEGKKGEKFVHELAIEQQNQASPSRSESKLTPVCLNRVQDPLTQKGKSGPSIHAPFDELQFGHLPLDLTVVDGPG